MESEFQAAENRPPSLKAGQAKKWWTETAEHAVRLANRIDSLRDERGQFLSLNTATQGYGPVPYPDPEDAPLNRRWRELAGQLHKIAAETCSHQNAQRIERGPSSTIAILYDGTPPRIVGRAMAQLFEEFRPGEIAGGREGDFWSLMECAFRYLNLDDRDHEWAWKAAIDRVVGEVLEERHRKQP